MNRVQIVTVTPTELDEVLSKVDVDTKAPTTLPKEEDIFKAETLCPPEKTKVIIIGQEPYPNREDATGLAFSTPRSRAMRGGSATTSTSKKRKLPAPLKTIFRDLVDDMGVPMPTHGDLRCWATQGVLLLNSILTVEEGRPFSHAHKGWEEYTDQVINKVVPRDQPLVIMAWGAYAKKKVARLSLHDKVLVLTGGHPSPFNSKVPFRGGFSEANAWLKTHGVSEIDWKVI